MPRGRPTHDGDVQLAIPVKVSDRNIVHLIGQFVGNTRPQSAVGIAGKHRDPITVAAACDNHIKDAVVVEVSALYGAAAVDTVVAFDFEALRGENCAGGEKDERSKRPAQRCKDI
jgi:hypothetical protein